MSVRSVVAVAVAVGLGFAGSARAEGAQDEAKKKEGATVAVAAGEGVTITAPDGVTGIKIGFYGQFRFQYLKRDIWRRSNLVETFPPFSVQNYGREEPSFQVRRLRLTASGAVWKSWMNYGVEIDLAGNDEGLRHVFIPPVFTAGGVSDFPGVDITAGPSDQDGRTLKLQDWYLDLTPKPYAQLRMGQFKIPFSRAELVSDKHLQLAQRSIANDFFSPGRDRGAMFHGGTDTGRVQYYVGAFNGTGLAQTQNLDTTLGYAARLTATSSGPFLDVEDPVDQPAVKGVRVQGGISWYQTTDTPIRQNPQIAESDIRRSSYTADLALMFPRGNLILDSYQRRIEVDQGFDLPQSCYGAFLEGRFSCEQYGYSAQGGVLLGRARTHELALRYAKTDDDKELANDSTQEETLNYTWFFYKQVMRVSFAVSHIEIGVNAVGSSGYALKVASPNGDFLNPADYPGLEGDDNWLGVVQFQWAF